MSQCKWSGCGQRCESSAELGEHVRSVHVDAMSRQEVIVCLWEDCKVYNRPCSNRSWLERHMATHTKEKPFKCLIDACACAFATRDGLARHMPQHFSEPSNSEGTSHRQSRQNSKKSGVQYRQPAVHARQWRWGAGSAERYLNGNMELQCLSGVCADKFNGHVMNSVSTRTADLQLLTLKTTASGQPCLQLRSQVLPQRCSGRENLVLLRWLPVGILPDEWVPADAVQSHRHRHVPFSQLSSKQLSACKEVSRLLFLPGSRSSRRRK